MHMRVKGPMDLVNKKSELRKSVTNICKEQKLFYKKGVLKNSQISQENTCVGVSFLINIVDRRRKISKLHSLKRPKTVPKK